MSVIRTRARDGRSNGRPVALVAALILLSICPSPARAHSFVPKPFDELVSDAEQIFAGTVSATQSRRLPSGLIVTEVTFSLARVFKGARAAEVTLLMPGGEIGGEALRVAGMPELRAGNAYLVFAKGNGRAILPLVGGTQGLFQIERDPVTAEEFVVDARGAAIESDQIRALAGQARDGAGAPRIPLDAIVGAISERLRR